MAQSGSSYARHCCRHVSWQRGSCCSHDAWQLGYSQEYCADMLKPSIPESPRYCQQMSWGSFDFPRLCILDATGAAKVTFGEEVFWEAIDWCCGFKDGCRSYFSLRVFQCTCNTTRVVNRRESDYGRSFYRPNSLLLEGIDYEKKRFLTKGDSPR